MGRIEVTPEEVARVGASIAALGPELSVLQAAVHGVSSRVSEPPATATALGKLATQWRAGAQRLEDDIVEVGRMTEGSAVLYRETDFNAMGMRGS